ncbi:hypothetical protein GYMLUDRAFT_251109 [Collybiopsis luxurians FD-317 M1]|uniref:Uncharacterized protein n=1 Tax=Collybiopsis luxurians FD-317 M1 TaxID=944289 RepID=A0A0D0CCJ3_9AGAR|nr:hypothetical protein GYMLUDRAFT_251109 [Collybiopsis luxurians FD-317 M1]
MSPNSELCSPKTGEPGDGEYIISHSLFGLMHGWRTSAWSRHPQQMNAVTVHFNKQYRLPPLTLSATVAQLNNREDLCIMVVNSLIGKYNAILEGKMLPPTPPMVWKLAYKLQPALPPSSPSPMPCAASYPPSSPLAGPSRHPPFPEDRLGSSPVPDTSPSPLEHQTSHCAASYPPSSPVAGPLRPLPFPGDNIGSSPVPDTSPSPLVCQTSQHEADKKLICRRDVCHLFDDNIDVIEDYLVGACLGAHGPLSPVSKVDEGEEEGSLVGVEVDEEEEEDSPAGVEEDEKLSKELPVVEEEEEYEEEEWNSLAPDEPVQQSVDSPPAERQLSSMKGKECTVETVSDDEGKDDTDALNGEAVSAEGEGKNKAGALCKEWIMEALQLKTDYCWHIKALAKRIGKSEAAVFSAIGEVVKEPHKMNMWNQFQYFMVVEDGMDWKQQPGQCWEEFQASIQQAYKEVLDLPEKKKDYYVVQLNEWYVKKMHDHTSEEQASLMYDTHGLSFFRWVVDPVMAKAVQWGGDELFEGMRNANASTLKVQSVDYSTMIHTQYMRLQQDNLLLPEKQKFIDCYLDQKSWLRTAFKDILVLLLCEVHPESNLQEFHWGASFADMCAKWKVCLVGWLVHLKVPGAPGDAGLTAMWQIPVNNLKVLVKCQLKAWKKGVSGEGNSVPLFEDDEGKGKGKGKGSNSDDEDDEDEGGELVHFIPWDEAEDQAHIPISKKYQLHLSNALIIDDNDNNNVGTGAAQRGRKTGKDRKESEAIDEAAQLIAGKSRKNDKAQTERKSSEEGGAVAGKIKKSDKPRKECESNEEEGTVAGKSKKSDKAQKESENGRSRKDHLGKQPKLKALPHKESLPDKNPPAHGSNTGNGSNNDDSNRLPSPPPPLSDKEDVVCPQKQSKKAAV